MAGVAPHAPSLARARARAQRGHRPGRGHAARPAVRGARRAPDGRGPGRGAGPLRHGGHRRPPPRAAAAQVPAPGRPAAGARLRTARGERPGAGAHARRADRARLRPRSHRRRAPRAPEHAGQPHQPDPRGHGPRRGPGRGARPRVAGLARPDRCDRRVGAATRPVSARAGRGARAARAPRRAAAPRPPARRVPPRARRSTGRRAPPPRWRPRLRREQLVESVVGHAGRARLAARRA